MVWRGLKIGIFIFPMIYLLRPRQAQTMTNQCWQGLDTSFQMSVCFGSPINIGHWTVATARTIVTNFQEYKAFLVLRKIAKLRIFGFKWKVLWVVTLQMWSVITLARAGSSSHPAALLVSGICETLLFPPKSAPRWWRWRWLCWL